MREFIETKFKTKDLAFGQLTEQFIHCLLYTSLLIGCFLQLLFPPVLLIVQTPVFGIDAASVTFAEFGCVLLDLLVELVKVDVSQHGADYSTLRSS